MSEVAGGKIVPDITNTTVQVGAGFGGLTDGQCAVEENAEVLQESESGTVVSSS